MIVPVVGRFDQHRDKSILHLLDDVDERVAEGTAGVDGTFTLELNAVAL